MLEAVQISLEDYQVLMAFDGRCLHDILYLSHDGNEEIGAIYLAKIERPIKGLGGVFVSLGGKKKGFWRVKNPPREGTTLPLQIVQTAMNGKPPRFSERIDFRGRLTVLTPDRPGINVSKTWEKPLSEDLKGAIGHILPDQVGVILRSEAQDVNGDDIIAELELHLALYQKINSAKDIGVIAPAPIGAERVRIEWGVDSCQNALSDEQKDALYDALSLPRIAAGGSIQIQKTEALIAVDVDTGVNTALSAGRDVNRASISEIIRWLKFMAWGGQLLVDAAPMPMQARKGYEAIMKKTAKECGIALTPRGFGPLGLFEAQIRYARRSLPANILTQLNINS